MNKTKLKRFLRNPKNRSYRQSTLRVKVQARKKYAIIWDEGIFKETNNEEGD